LNLKSINIINIFAIFVPFLYIISLSFLTENDKVEITVKLNETELQEYNSNELENILTLNTMS